MESRRYKVGWEAEWFIEGGDEMIKSRDTIQ